MEEKQITKKEDQLEIHKKIDSILGGSVGDQNDEGLKSKDYKSEIQQYEATGKSLVETLEIEDPITHKKSIYELDRGGTRDQKLAMILADPSADEQKKMGMLSLYLFERGKESASFITDLMLYKGAHTKESRQFQSRMQYDWTFFVGMFASFLLEQATTMLGSVLPTSDIMTVEYDALEYLKKEKEKYETEKRKDRPTLHEWATNRYHQVGDPNATQQEEKFAILMLELAVRSASQAHSLKQEIQNLAEERERVIGKPFPNTPKVDKNI